MKILVACEESQRVCTAFRKRGHWAFSCDIEPCSGGCPQWHIQGDVLPLLGGNCEFRTSDDNLYKLIGEWDMIIAHPPCTYLSNACNRAYSLNCNTLERVIERYQKRDLAVRFFVTIANANCDKIVIENPQGYMNTHYRPPDQVIHPYYFASGTDDKENYVQKRTCLWLKGVEPLERWNNLPKPSSLYISSSGKEIGWCEGLRGIKGSQKERSKMRSKTFPGIAEAMAAQWG